MTLTHCFLFSGLTQNSGNYVRIIKHAIQQVGPEQVNLVITDSAPVMVSAGKTIEHEYPRIAHQPCVVHLLDCWMEDVERLGPVKKVVEDANKLVNFICNHHMTYAIFNTFSRLKLLKCCQTR